MYKIILLLIILCASLFVTAHADESEQLIIPDNNPFIKWKMAEKKSEKVDMYRWIADNPREFMQLVIYRNNKGASASGTIISNDEAVKEKCDSYDSKMLFNGKQNGFDTALSKSVCKTGGKTVTLLTKNISGYSSFYSVFKRWEKEAGDDEFKLWNEYFKKIILCKDGMAAHPCPEMPGKKAK